MYAALALAALLIEAAVGYPQPLFHRIGHPVTWIGAVIGWCDRYGNRTDWSSWARRRAGEATLLVLLVLAICAGLLLTLLLRAALGPWPAFAIAAIAASALIAQRSLHRHVADVADMLETGGVAAGRQAVGRIVGRDTAELDEGGISRAAIESLAENFSDGVVAPAFWLMAAGLPGALAYKAVNTADSMIGHKSDRHRDFGRASALFDDLVNLPASRLSALLLAGAARLSPGLSARAALDVARRDARLHRSPNAGWPEAAMAGALGLQLAGPRIYAGKRVDDAFMGDGRREIGAADIRRALALYRRACALLVAVMAMLVVVAAVLGAPR